MTREELIEIGKKIVATEGTEEEQDMLHELFSKNVPHPSGANLFFYPENYNARRDDLSKYNPSVDKVVDMALSCRSLQL